MKQSDRRKALFESWVRDYGGDIYRRALRLCGDSNCAEELAQEVFFEGWRSMDSLRHPAKARVWLLSILRHRYMHWLRDEKRRPKASALFTVSSSSADDWGIIDWTFGNPCAAGGLHIDGLAGGADTISVIGTTAADAVTFAAAGETALGGASFSHAGFERVTFDGKGGWGQRDGHRRAVGHPGARPGVAVADDRPRRSRESRCWRAAGADARTLARRAAWTRGDRASAGHAADERTTSAS